jgi:copper chaperone CopZ
MEEKTCESEVNKVWRYLKKLNPDSKGSIKIFENNFGYDSEEETMIEYIWKQIHLRI